MLLIFSCLLMGQFSRATSYYVSTSGSDANAGNNINTPYLTVQKAISKAVAGDTIFVRSGTYTVGTTVKITKPGTAAKNITLTAYLPDVVSAYPNDTRPLFDFSSMAVNSGNYGFHVTNANYWKIYGLRIKGAGDNGMNVENTAYTTIEYCDFFRNRDAGFLIRSSSHHCLILNCDAYENADLGAGTTTSGGNADGFAPKLEPGDTITFRGCRAWLNSDDGWDGYLKAIEAGVPDGMTTFLENCWTWRNGYYWLDGSTTASQNGNGFKMGGSANKNQAHNFVLVRCLSFMNKANGFDQNNNAGSIGLYNCTGYANLGLDYQLNNSGVTYAASSVFNVTNCASLGTKGTSFKTGTVRATNSFIKAATSANYLSTDTTGISGRRKIDGSLPDVSFMHLQTSPQSTLIEAGTLLPNISYYGNKGVPYKGTKPDLGCFESNVGASLPVELLRFTASNTSSGVQLNWVTATESNNLGWEIERKNRGNESWVVVGFMEGKNTRSRANYQFIDAHVQANASYSYRLKQTNVDGSIRNSNILEITPNQVKSLLEIFPNPVNNQSTIRFSITRPSKVNVTVYDAIGRPVKSLIHHTMETGIYARSLNGMNLPSGNYIVRLLCDGLSEASVLIHVQ